MQHANRTSLAAVASTGEEALQGASLHREPSRSARTEMLLREVATLQAQTARVVEAIESTEDAADGGHMAGQPCSAAMIRKILEARLARASAFPGDLFSDPAWDMLLDLYAAQLDQVRVSVTSLCIASNAPASTALRWISALEHRNLIERTPDPLDGRRFFMSLTSEAKDMFERYFSSIGPLAVI